MILKNPTKSDVSAVISGYPFTIPAEGTLSIRNDYGKYWKEKLHNFLEIVDEGSEEVIADESVAPVEETDTETVEEESTEEEQPSEEAPKKKGLFGKKK